MPQPLSAWSRAGARAAVVSTVPVLLACGGVLDCGRTVNKVIPAVREIDPDFNTEPIDCDNDYPAPTPKGCYIEKISCDSVIEANNESGFRHFDETFYQAHYCTPERHGYADGQDSPYVLDVPPNTWVDVVLTSDCVDLDVFSASWDKPTKCPTASHTNINCEADTTRRGGSITITSVNRPEKHLVWVDGKHGAVGNYRLEVKCRTYR